MDDMYTEFAEKEKAIGKSVCFSGDKDIFVFIKRSIFLCICKPWHALKHRNHLSSLLIIHFKKTQNYMHAVR